MIKLAIKFKLLYLAHTVVEKRQVFSLIDEQNPNIICGCESHLNKSYHTAEIFPNGYSYCFEKRSSGGCRGVVHQKESKEPEMQN